ncbi:GntR family transcriptional regulator [Salsuginibacillus halophilus]|uniref:GntR family transcriptional regulator n=1 Tax=Salsuginibacillus halophilus TaxID=517424 RepID=A0A2P8HL61_9BACI|nr:GntR family transcriptional regulator [Salsuginibacillus halophilus]PSL46957.1 GntR family transcriptional regulator [Salsuginibacillus halophilus]
MSDEQRKLPLYLQIKNKMVNNIKEGAWKPGEAIPSENRLIEQYNVSRTTIRQSIRELVQDGVLETRRGTPTRVRQTPKEEEGNPGVVHHELGEELSVQVLRSDQCADRYYAKGELMLDDIDEVFFFERVRMADARPIAYQQLFLPKPVGEKVKDDAAKMFDIFPALGMHDVHYKNIKETVSASNATQYEADILGLIPGEALVDIERTTLGIDGIPIEYSRTKYITSAFNYRIEIGR